MAYFLRDKDYNAIIRQGNLDQITAADITTRQFCELTAQAEMTSYLSNRYLCPKIFSPLLTWSTTTAFKWNDRLFLNGSTYAALTVYVLNDLVNYTDGNVYQRNSTTLGYVAGTLPTDTSYFDLLGANAIYYVTPPSQYDSTVTYTLASKVTYKNYVYNLSNINGYIAGVDPSNTNYWTVVTDYAPFAIPVNTLPSDDTYWTLGDPRNQQVVMYMVDIVCYHVHSNLNPRNIPQLRTDRYQNAINWMKMVNAGDVTADLPEILPIQGYTILYGSNPKRPQFY